MSADNKSLDLPVDSGDGDEVEILEVVGIDDEIESISEPSRSEPEPEPEDDVDPDEIVLSLDDEDELELADEGEPIRFGSLTSIAPIPAAPDPPEDVADRVALARLQADYDNLRKRLDRERREFEGQANFTLVGRLLPVLDNFERALGATRRPNSDAAVWQGLDMIYRQLMDELKREGMVPVEAVGTTFDPKIHDAVEIEGGGDEVATIVVEELQRGYRFRDRLLRPAMVKVGFGELSAVDTSVESEEG